MLVLIGSMRLMTGLAASSLDVFVNMQEVQVLISVSEVGQGHSCLIECDILIMALKAHRIILGFIRHVEFAWEILPEQSEILGSMSVVTGTAVSLIDRSMLVFLAGNKLLQIGMTGKTEFGCSYLKHLGLRR